MIYKSHEIPTCPNCSEKVDTYVGEETGEGVKNLGLSRALSVVDCECDNCYEEFTVFNMGKGKYEVTI